MKHLSADIADIYSFIDFLSCLLRILCLGTRQSDHTDNRTLYDLYSITSDKALQEQLCWEAFKNMQIWGITRITTVWLGCQISEWTTKGAQAEKKPTNVLSTISVLEKITCVILAGVLLWGSHVRNRANECLLFYQEGIRRTQAWSMREWQSCEKSGRLRGKEGKASRDTDTGWANQTESLSLTAMRHL